MLLYVTADGSDWSTASSGSYAFSSSNTDSGLGSRASNTTTNSSTWNGPNWTYAGGLTGQTSTTAGTANGLTVQQFGATSNVAYTSISYATSSSLYNNGTTFSSSGATTATLDYAVFDYSSTTYTYISIWDTTGVSSEIDAYTTRSIASHTTTTGVAPCSVSTTTIASTWGLDGTTIATTFADIITNTTVTLTSTSVAGGYIAATGPVIYDSSYIFDGYRTFVFDSSQVGQTGASWQLIRELSDGEVLRFSDYHATATVALTTAINTSITTYTDSAIFTTMSASSTTLTIDRTAPTARQQWLGNTPIPSGFTGTSTVATIGHWITGTSSTSSSRTTFVGATTTAASGTISTGFKTHPTFTTFTDLRRKVYPFSTNADALSLTLRSTTTNTFVATTWTSTSVRTSASNYYPVEPGASAGGQFKYVINNTPFAFASEVGGAFANTAFVPVEPQGFVAFGTAGERDTIYRGLYVDFVSDTDYTGSTDGVTNSEFDNLGPLNLRPIPTAFAEQWHEGLGFKAVSAILAGDQFGDTAFAIGVFTDTTSKVYFATLGWISSPGSHSSRVITASLARTRTVSHSCTSSTTPTSYSTTMVTTESAHIKGTVNLEEPQDADSMTGCMFGAMFDVAAAKSIFGGRHRRGKSQTAYYGYDYLVLRETTGSNGSTSSFTQSAWSRTFTTNELVMQATYQIYTMSARVTGPSGALGFPIVLNGWYQNGDPQAFQFDVLQDTIFL
jgi:hypothetical protein